MGGWLSAVFGLEPGFASGIGFVVTLALLAAIVWAIVTVARNSGFGRLGRTKRSRQPRLAVMDVTEVDHRRRLVLVRRDHVEHLILIGGPSDVVVEENILRPGAGDLQARPQTDRVMEPVAEEDGAEVAPTPAAAASPAETPVPPLAEPAPANSEPRARPAPAARAPSRDAEVKRAAPAPRGFAPRPVPQPQTEQSSEGSEQSRPQATGDSAGEARRRWRPGGKPETTGGPRPVDPAAARRPRPDATPVAPRTAANAPSPAMGASPEGARAASPRPAPSASRPAGAAMPKGLAPAPVPVPGENAGPEEDAPTVVMPQEERKDVSETAPAETVGAQSLTPERPAETQTGQSAAPTAPQPAANASAESDDSSSEDDDDDGVLDLEDEMARLLKGVGSGR